MKQNKTFKYLVKIVKEYNLNFKNELLRLNKHAWGIGDVYYEKLKSCEYNLFVLVDGDIDDFLFKFRNFDYYTDDYRFDDTRHMLVFRLPDAYKLSYDNFKDSKYSKMFNQEQLNKLTSENSEVYKILTKDTEYKQVFQDKLYTLFNTRIDLSNDDRELDFPIDLKEEYFNASS